MSAEKKVKILDRTPSSAPLEVDFEARPPEAVTVRPTTLENLRLGFYSSDHLIVRQTSRHSGATSTFNFEPQPGHVNPETVAMSWMLRYDADADGEARAKKVESLLYGQYRGAMLRGERYPFSASLVGYNERQTAYSLFNKPTGMNLLAVANHGDQLISVSNTGYIRNTSSIDVAEAEARPVDLSRVPLADQLQVFGNAVAAIGRYAIPDMVPLDEAVDARQLATDLGSV